MLIMTSIIRVGRSDFPTSPIDEDSYDRIATCLRTLSSVPEDELMREIFLGECRRAFRELVESQEVSLGLLLRAGWW